MDKAIIRIENIALSNIKNVADGFISLNDVSDDTFGASIVGIYGQNGSGKTALIWAVELIKDAISGAPLPADTFFYIRQQSKTATIKVELLLNFGDRDYNVFYTLTVGKEENENDFETLNREYQEETGFSNLIKNENQIELIGKTFTQNIDTEKENTFFIMESRYYLIKISDEEFSKIKNVGQDLDDYEKDLNFTYKFISVKDAYEKNKSLLVCSNGETVNFWVERETLVLEKLM